MTAFLCGPNPPTAGDLTVVEQYRRFLAGEMDDAERALYIAGRLPLVPRGECETCLEPTDTPPQCRACAEREEANDGS